MKGSEAREEKENEIKKHCSPELIHLNKISVHIDLYSSRDIVLRKKNQVY
jgi:hypothetical protein